MNIFLHKQWLDSGRSFECQDRIVCRSISARHLYWLLSWHPGVMSSQMLFSFIGTLWIFLFFIYSFCNILLHLKNARRISYPIIWLLLPYKKRICLLFYRNLQGRVLSIIQLKFSIKNIACYKGLQQITLSIIQLKFSKTSIACWWRPPGNSFVYYSIEVFKDSHCLLMKAYNNCIFLLFNSYFHKAHFVRYLRKNKIL